MSENNRKKSIVKKVIQILFIELIVSHIIFSLINEQTFFENAIYTSVSSEIEITLETNQNLSRGIHYKSYFEETYQCQNYTYICIKIIGNLHSRLILPYLYSSSTTCNCHPFIDILLENSTLLPDEFGPQQVCGLMVTIQSILIGTHSYPFSFEFLFFNKSLENLPYGLWSFWIGFNGKRDNSTRYRRTNIISSETGVNITQTPPPRIEYGLVLGLSLYIGIFLICIVVIKKKQKKTISNST